MSALPLGLLALALLAALAWGGGELQTWRDRRALRQIRALTRRLPGNALDGPRVTTESLRRKLAPGDSLSLRLDTAMRLHLDRAGLALPPPLFLAGLVAGAGGVTLLGLSLGVGTLVSLALGIGGTGALATTGLHLRAKHRQTVILRGFADATDAMVRSLRAGLPLPEIIRHMSRDLQGPIQEMFRRMTEETGLGVPLDQAATRAADRLGLPEIRFFAIVLAIQQQTGGNMAESLGNLTDLLRARRRLRDKVRALSSEARASAAIIGSMPFLVAGLLWLANPDYLAPLWQAGVGRWLLLGGLGWMGIGILTMRRMLDLRL